MLDNDDAFERGDFSHYRRAVSDAVVPLDLFTEEPDRFRGGLAAEEHTDIHVLGVRADAHAVHRTASLIARVPQSYVKFTVVEQGNGMILQGGREVALGPGDMTVYDTDRPYSLLFNDEVRMSIVMFPREMLALSDHAFTQIAASRLGNVDGLGALVRPYISALTQRELDVKAYTTRRLFRSAVDMIATLVEAEAPQASGAASHYTLFQSILEYIDANLSDPELGPVQIAAAHFISVRHLQAVFSEQRTTVSTMVRSRRLEKSYSDLISPSNAGRPVAAIASQNGFIDAAHFSRAFRAHFGVSPSSLRDSSSR